MKLHKPRFSLRTLLVLVTLIGFLAYWQSRPAQLADRFVAAIEAGDYAAADRMFLHKQQEPLAAIMQRRWPMSISAKREPPSLLDWIKGVSRVSIVIDDRSSWDHYTNIAIIEVTRRGVQDPAWTVENITRGPGVLADTSAVM